MADAPRHPRKPVRAALWLRVSGEGQTTENQRQALMPFGGQLGLEVVREYDVTGSAWKGDQRAALAAALAAAKAGRYQVLLVWKLDRLTRQGGEDLLAILNAFGAAGIQVRSLHDAWLSGPLTHDGKLLGFIEGWRAEGESLLRSQRTRAGLARVRAQGKHIGRPKGAKDKKPGARPREGYKREAARRLLAPAGQYRNSRFARSVRFVDCPAV